MSERHSRRHALRLIGGAGAAVGAVLTADAPVGAATAETAPTASTPAVTTLSVTGVRWQIRRDGDGRGRSGAVTAARLPHGDLVSDDGRPLGRFTSAPGTGALIGNDVHHLDLGDGTITGLSSGGQNATHGTVLSGTGRYGSARGTYTLSQQFSPAGNVADIVLTLIMES